jgi:hypothetical protein
MRGDIVKNFILGVFVSSLLAIALCTGAAAQQGRVVAAADDQSNVMLFWTPAQGQWPEGGWRIVDEQNNTVVDRIVVADPKNMQALSADQQAQVKKLAAGLVSSDANTQKKSLGMVAVNAMSNPDFARAMGMACTLTHVSPGTHTYKIVGLDHSGKLSNLMFSSDPINTLMSTPLPPSPTGVTAVMTTQGVALYWTPVSDKYQGPPAVAYWVQRQDYGMLTKHPVVLGTKWDSKTAAYLDKTAPVEEELDYSVYSVDVLGRQSAATPVHILAADVKAIRSPLALKATATDNKVSLQWTPSTNPNTTGYILERARLFHGPYEPLTKTALAHNMTSYVDTGMVGGITYFYRLRSMNVRGELGEPSDPVAAHPTNTARPPKPAKPQLDAGISRVRVIWQPVQFPVAGYFVERQTQGQTQGIVERKALIIPHWKRLNSRLVRGPFYDDYVGSQTYGTLAYRIVAVGLDSKESDPGDFAQTTLEDPSLPDVPNIASIDGTGGKVILTFSSRGEVSHTSQFLVLRSTEENDIGLVIGDPIPAASPQFTDDGVQAGHHYWYRVVALDSKGNRSDTSLPAVVRVGAPLIAKPPAPVVKYLTQPFPSAEIDFQLPDTRLSVMVHVRRGVDGIWTTLAGPVQGQTKVVDSNIQEGVRNFYRVVYRAANNLFGEASDPVELNAK